MEEARRDIRGGPSLFMARRAGRPPTAAYQEVSTVPWYFSSMKALISGLW